MSHVLYQVFVGLIVLLGSAFALLGLVDSASLNTLLSRYFSYGGTMTFNPETIVRFSHSAPMLGWGLLGLAAALHWLREPLRRMAGVFDIDERAWGRKPLLALFLISVAGLFLEIVLIRWISVEIRIFAYFKNLALLACFIGFGLGAGMARKRISYLVFVAPLFLLVVLVQLDPFLGPLSLRRAAALIAPQQDLLYWGAFTTNSLLHAIGFTLVGLTFLLVVLPFVPVGQLVARLLSSGQPIKAYSVNIAGSLIGLWLYSLVSFLWLPPAAWFGLPLVMSLWLLRPKREAFWSGLAVSLSMMALLLVPSQVGRVYWSPYQKLVLTPREDARGGAFHHIDVNNTFYQTMENGEQRLEHHRFPYLFVPKPKRVLLVGAGAGNDAAEALRHGASQVDAVDIDPVILTIGKALHPDRPYDSDRVTRILNDARAHFKRAEGNYDVIVYARLDSHTLLSGFTNVRLDHYVYTRESFEEAKRLLAPDGVLVMSFVSMEPWIRERLSETMKVVFGQEPLNLSPFSLVVGSQERIKAALARHPDLAARVFPLPSPSGVKLTTDDWPYLYLKEPKVPSLHWLMSVFVVAMVGLLLRGSGLSPGKIDWHFFFLGAAFLLLEFQGVSRFALLFGTTWLVNTIVISAFLIMILAANWYVQRTEIRNLRPYYVGLLASVMLVLLPQQIWLGQSVLVRGLIAGALQAAPVFFAGIIFATSFKRVADIPTAFASNLLGSVFGGLLESLSYVIGITSLGWLVMALYALSWTSLQGQWKLAWPAGWSSLLRRDSLRAPATE